MDMATPQGVLVLNRFWQAVHICSVRRAFSLLYMGHAQVVEGNGAGDDFRTFDFHRWRELSQDYDGEDAVRTISFRIRIPRVIVLMLFDRIPKKEVKLTRQNIFERDSYTCQYCGVVQGSAGFKFGPCDSSGSWGYDDMGECGLLLHSM